MRRKERVGLAAVVRRIADLTCPNLAPLDGESRSENRYNRSLPALLAPWQDGDFVAAECACAITKDVSDRGVALVLSQPFRAAEVVVGFWPATPHRAASVSSPYFVRGEVRENVEIGGGFWHLGVRLTTLLSEPSQIDRLTPLAARLLPPKPWADKASPASTGPLDKGPVRWREP